MHRWRSAFINNNDGSYEDRRIYEAGVFFDTRLKIIRDQFNHIVIPGSKNLSIKYLVGYLNLQNSYGEIKEKEAIFQKKGFDITEVLKYQSESESLIEASRYPINEMLNSAQINISEDVSLDNILSFLEKRRTSILYHGFEKLFNKCLWEGYFVEQHDSNKQEIDVIKPSNKREIERYEINNTRWSSIVQVGQVLEWQFSTSDSVKESLLNSPKISASPIDKDQRVKLHLSPPDRHSNLELTTEVFLDAYFMKNSQYPENFYEEPLKKLNGLTLIEMILMRHLISSLIRSLQIEVSNNVKNRIINEDEFLNACPIIYRSELTNVLASAINISQKKANTFIELLIFKNAKSDLFKTPFIELSSNDLAIILKAAESPNPLRLFSGWMQKAKYDIGKKGSTFEKHARSKLLRVNKLSSVDIYPEEFWFNDGKEGDIDLILKLGNKILVCELKCSIFPVEPHEVFDYFAYLKDVGVRQALRSKKFIERNKNILSDKFNFNVDVYQNITVIPIVISNLFFATGYVHCDVPIVDLRIIEQYLSDGYFYKYSSFSASERPQPQGEKIYFYQSEEEAEENLIQYLLHPPQVYEHFSSVSWVATPSSISDLAPHFNLVCEEYPNISTPQPL